MKQSETSSRIDLSETELRDHASGRRIETIWRRLEDELPFAKRRSLSQGRLRPLFWVGAAFACGVVFGVEATGGSTTGLFQGAPAPALRAEPQTRARAATSTAPEERVATNEVDFAEPDRRDSKLKHGAPAVGRLAREQPAFAASRTVPVNAAAEPEWQHFAESGNYEAALRAIEAAGGFVAELQSASAERLMLLGDVARATGNRKLATQALRQVVDHHASDPLAPLAAWSLGNMLERAGDRLGAAEAFAVYRALSPQGDFAEDALARQVRVAVEEADLTLATRLAAQYDKSFPDGRRAKEIREQLARLRDRVSLVSGNMADAAAEAASVAAPQTPAFDDIEPEDLEDTEAPVDPAPGEGDSP